MRILRGLVILAGIIIVATACTSESSPTDTPDIQGTIDAAVRATAAAQPTATGTPIPTATPTLMPTSTPTFTPSPTIPIPTPTFTPTATRLPPPKPLADNLQELIEILGSSLEQVVANETQAVLNEDAWSHGTSRGLDSWGNGFIGIAYAYQIVREPPERLTIFPPKVPPNVGSIESESEIIDGLKLRLSALLQGLGFSSDVSDPIIEQAAQKPDQTFPTNLWRGGFLPESFSYFNWHPDLTIAIGNFLLEAIWDGRVCEPSGPCWTFPLILSLRSQSALSAAPTPTPVSPTPTPDPFNQLEIQSFRCTTDSAIGFAFIRGEVTNVSGRRLENVVAVGTWRTADGTFIVSDDALIDFDPLLPGQTSPFEIISRYNPLMSRCNLQFKHLFGEQIPARER